MSERDELRELAHELLDAEEAHWAAPTLQNVTRLGRVRRRLIELFDAEPQR